MPFLRRENARDANQSPLESETLALPEERLSHEQEKRMSREPVELQASLLKPYCNSGRFYDLRWPNEEVSCGLRVSEWRRLAEACNLQKEATEVISGLLNGFHQGIPDHTLGNMRWFTPDNHKSAHAAEDKIRNTLAKEKKAGQIFGPFQHEEVFQKIGFFRSSPMGSVINGDGSFRVINDMSFPQNDKAIPSVNSFVDKKDFDTSWDDFKTLAKFFSESEGDFLLAIFDWEKAYRQIPVCPSQWRYLLILDLEGQLWLDTRVQFGGVAGCGVFGRPADLWRAIMKKKFRLAGAFRWVDDNLLVKQVDNKTEINDIVDLSKSMGVASSSEKVYDFGIEQRYIGFIWNAGDRTVRLPAEKLRERLEQITHFLSPGSVFTLKETERFIGRLVHTTYIVPNMNCYLASLFRWKKEWKVLSATRPIPTDVKADLNEWKRTLETFDARRFIPAVEATNIGWVGDAASSFGIGILIGDWWAQFKLKTGWKHHLRLSEKGGIAWAETAAIRLGLLMVSKLFNVRGKKFVVLTDNTTSECVVQKHRSRDWAVNNEWKAIQSLLVDLQCDIVAERVTSKDNKADDLSRGSGVLLPLDRTVLIELPVDLKAVLDQTFQSRVVTNSYSSQ